MLSYNLGIKNGKNLTNKEITEATKSRVAGAFTSTSKLCENGWGVVCQNNKLIFTHPNIVTLQDTLQHLKNLNLSSEPLEFSTAIQAQPVYQEPEEWGPGDVNYSDDDDDDFDDEDDDLDDDDDDFDDEDDADDEGFDDDDDDDDDDDEEFWDDFGDDDDLDDDDDDEFDDEDEDDDDDDY